MTDFFTAPFRKYKSIFHHKKFKKPEFYKLYPQKLDIRIIDSRSVISHQYNFIYFRIPKAGNSTVISSLYFAETGKVLSNLKEANNLKENHYSRLSSLNKHQVTELKENYLKFSIVRNPYTRILSGYLDKITKNAKGKRDLVNVFLGESLDNEVTFDQFLSYLESGGVFENAHWARQTDLIPINIEHLDYIGKLETLNQSLQDIICKIFDKKSNVISVTDHSTNSSIEHELLNDVSKKRIQKIYECDFHRFSYHY